MIVPRSEAHAWLVSEGHHLPPLSGLYMAGDNLMFLLPQLTDKHVTERLILTIAHELTHAMTYTLRLQAGLYKDGNRAKALGKVGSTSNAFEEGTAELLVHHITQRLEEYFGLQIACKDQIYAKRAYKPQQTNWRWQLSCDAALPCLSCNLLPGQPFISVSTLHARPCDLRALQLSS